MATCTVDTTPFERVVMRRQFHLTLDEDEAATLVVVLGNIAGDPSSSPRKHTTATRRALISHSPADDRRGTIQALACGEIRFEDYPHTGALW